MYKTNLATKEKISSGIMMGKKIYLFNNPQNVLFAVYDPIGWLKHFPEDKLCFIIKPKKK